MYTIVYNDYFNWDYIRMIWRANRHTGLCNKINILFEKLRHTQIAKTMVAHW